MSSNTSLMADSWVGGSAMARVALVPSSSSASSRLSRWRARVPHCGLKWAVAFVCIQSANASLSQMSSHQAAVT